MASASEPNEVADLPVSGVKVAEAPLGAVRSYDLDTVCPATRKYRDRPAPYELLPSTPNRSRWPNLQTNASSAA